MEKSKRTVLLSGIIWVVTYLVCLLIVKKLPLPKWAGISLALIPAFTFALFIYRYIKKISSMDEVEIRIQLEAVVWGFSLALLLPMILGSLNLVITLNNKNWGYLSLVNYFVLFYFIGLIISQRKYR
ncbi:MAG: hypothetical protein ABI685_06355 [Ferruginibacter sp.]